MDQTKNEEFLCEILKKDSNILARNSLNHNDTSHDKSSEISEESFLEQVNYINERRYGRNFSTFRDKIKNKAFNVVIIPYNFEEKKYYLKSKEIEFYENKEYLKDKLLELNNNENFNIEKSYRANGWENFKIMLPTIIIILIFVYIGLVISVIFFFNPVVIYMIINWITKLYRKLKMFKFIILEKYKMKKIKNIIENENSSDFCKSNKIEWKIGQSGYWLEVQKVK